MGVGRGELSRFSSPISKTPLSSYNPNLGRIPVLQSLGEAPSPLPNNLHAPILLDNVFEVECIILPWLKNIISNGKNFPPEKPLPRAAALPIPPKFRNETNSGLFPPVSFGGFRWKKTPFSELNFRTPHLETLESDHAYGNLDWAIWPGVGTGIHPKMSPFAPLCTLLKPCQSPPPGQSKSGWVLRQHYHDIH